MARKRIDQLGRLQAAVMELIWSTGPATVQDVLDRLDRQPAPAYTTILTVMQKLAKAGWLTHRKEGRSYVYSAARSREQEDRSALHSFVEQVFRGDAMTAFERLLDDATLEDDELDQLLELIRRKREEVDDV